MKTQQEIAEYWYNAYEDPRNDELSVYDAIDNALAEYAQQREQPWVRVADRLPENPDLFNDNVLFVSKGIVRNGCYDYEFCEWYERGGGTYKEATHWMPLPAPPKD